MSFGRLGAAGTGVGAAGSALLGVTKQGAPVTTVLTYLVPAPYWVSFYERDQPENRLPCRLGDTPPTPAGSTAGDWNVVTLPKRSAVTVWQGRLGLITMAIPIVLGDATSGPVLPASNALNAMWRPADPTVQPPVVKVRSPGDAVPYQSLDFVITDIAWGDMISGPQANRQMQKLTVTVLEYREDEVIQAVKASKPKHRGKTYTVKRGDTLSVIAKRFNVKGGWSALAQAQKPPIHDPRQLLVGQRLLIP